MGYEGLPFLVVSWNADRGHEVARLVRQAARRPVACAVGAGQARLRLREQREWAGLVVELQLGGNAMAGLDLVGEVVRLSPDTPALVHAPRLDRPWVNRAARLGVTVAWSPLDAAELRAFLMRARSLEALRAGFDARLQQALDAEVTRAGLGSRRAAELLQRAVAGGTREEIQKGMGIGPDCYAYHVTKLLRATEALDLQSLVIRIMRRALGVATDGVGSPARDRSLAPDRQVGPVSEIAGEDAVSGEIDRRRLLLAAGGRGR